jgi:hypothetical protein
MRPALNSLSQTGHLTVTSSVEVARAGTAAYARARETTKAHGLMVARAPAVSYRRMEPSATTTHSTSPHTNAIGIE